MYTSNPTIKCLLLDADGVIQKSSSGFMEKLSELCPDKANAGQMISEIFEAEQPCLTGEASFSEVLSAVLHRWASTSSLEEALQVWHMIEPIDFVMTHLRSLTTPIALATNQQDYRIKFMRESLGYGDLFDTFFVSCEIGHKKPSPEYFQAVVNHYARQGISAGQIGFIDDSEANVAAASAAGLNAETYVYTQGEKRFSSLLRELHTA